MDLEVLLFPHHRSLPLTDDELMHIEVLLMLDGGIGAGLDVSIHAHGIG